jgi:F0F1-type ATP synthase alpha subunit
VIDLGVVLTLIDGVARVMALDATFIGELIILSSFKAMTLNLEYLITGLTVLGNDRAVEQGDIAERSFMELLVEVGFFLVSRVIDPAANFLDEVSTGNSFEGCFNNLEFLVINAFY